MKLQLITGEFETKDALDLIKQMIELRSGIDASQKVLHLESVIEIN